MSTDRELLEAAARAAGFDYKWLDADEDAGLRGGLVKGIAAAPEEGHEGPWDFAAYWNPIQDDAEAFQLAVKLHLRVSAMDAKAVVDWWVPPGMTELDYVEELNGNDPYAATRRAIVRAAAALAPQQVKP